MARVVPASLWARRRLPPGLLVTAVTATVMTYGELSVEALVAVVASGCLLAGLGLARRVGSATEPVGRAGLPWLVWVVAVALWECLTYVLRERVPTLSDLVDPVLAHAIPRGAATVAWLAAGLWLVTRPSRLPGAR